MVFDMVRGPFLVAAAVALPVATTGFDQTGDAASVPADGAY
jgi:hypothetical protein